MYNLLNLRVLNKKDLYIYNKLQFYVGTSFSHFSTKESEINTSDVQEDLLLLEKQNEIERKRNKSGLYPHHRNVLFNRKPFEEIVADFQKTVKYNRRLYGRFGKESGVNPGIMWPTKEEIEEAKEYERIAYPYSVPELIERVKQKKAETNAQILARQEKILSNLLKLEQWKKEVLDKAAQKLNAAEEAKRKREETVEEIRQHFGFKIDPSDERFKQMLEQKELAERKAAKEEKRKLREAREIAKLRELSAGLDRIKQS